MKNKKNKKISEIIRQTKKQSVIRGFSQRDVEGESGTSIQKTFYNKKKRKKMTRNKNILK